MTYAQSNSIPSISKVIDTTLSSYSPKGTTAILPNDSQSQALTLHVLSARNNLVVLQEPSTGKRINIDKQSIDGADEAFLAKGDKLVLVNHNDKLSSFRLEQVSASNKLVNLKSFSQILSVHWPDIPPSAFKTNLPVVLNQLQLMNNSVQSKLLSNAIVEIAHKTGQPVLSLSADAKVSFTGYADTIDVAASSATGIRLTIGLSATKPFEINIPVLTEMTDKLNNGSTVKIEFNADSIKSPVNNITVNNKGILGDTISAASLRAINNSLKANATQLTPLLNTLLAEPQSTSLKTGIVLTPTAQNLATLGNSISRPLLQNGTSVAQAKLHETRILVTQSSTSNPHIHLTLLAKPVIMSIDNSQLSALSSKLFNAESNNKATLLSSTVVAQSELTANSKIFQLNEHKVTSAPNTSTNSIKDKLINMLVEQGNSTLSVQKTMASLQAVISYEMNQVLPRSVSLQNSLPALLTQLENLQQLAQGDTKIWLSKAIASIEKLVAKTTTQHLATNVDSVNKATPTIKPTKAAQNTVISPLSDSIDSGNAATLSDTSDIDVPDMAELKRDFTASLLPNLSAPAIAPISVNGSSSSLVNGLVAMLQASLQAKLLAQQPNLMNSLLSSANSAAQAASSMAGASGVKSAAANNTAKSNQAKILQDLHKLDPKGSLITELSKALSQHSLQKLSSAESTLQGQDSFYYTLPNLFSPQHQDIELLIKREQSNSQDDKEGKSQQAWQLNMKLDIGESGDVLAKVKLLGNHLELNLYASKQKLKEKILDYLPYLNRRLVALGLDVKQQCYLGKIPASLHKTDLQVVQAYV